MLHFAAVLGAGCDDVDTGGVDAGVTENVGKLGDVLLYGVKSAGKQVA